MTGPDSRGSAQSDGDPAGARGPSEASPVTTEVDTGTSAPPPTSLTPRRPKLFLDTTPLRLDRQFRLLWAGQVVSVMGNMVTRIALPYQVYVLTGSPLSIAILTAVQLLPILFLSLGAGALADAFDRRKLLIITQSGLATTNVGLLILALQPDPPIWAIYVLAGLGGSLLAVDWPARTSSVPRLVPRERIPAAIALNQINYNVSSIVGPAIGGLLLAWVGVAGAYAADLAAFCISFAALIALKPIPPLHLAMAPGLTAIREGLAFVRTKRVILSAFAIDLNATIFGMPTAVFPILALDVFRTGPAGVGMLAAAPAIGAFVAALFSGWISSVQRVGRAVVVAVTIWGIAITLFGLSTFSFELALVLLAIAGGADILSAILRSTIIQTETPDRFRGRVTSIHVMTASSGPRLGDIRAAAVASAIGAQLSVVSGGLICLLGAILTVRAFPELPAHHMRLRYRDQSAPEDVITSPGPTGPANSGEG